MRKVPIIVSILTLLLLSNCSEKPNLQGFNSEVWKNDKKGCNGKREYIAEKVFEQTGKLKGVDDDVIIDLFGKPESSDWESRGKKSFMYYTTPGSQCNSGILEGTKIVFEFDALGRVSLITEKRF